MLHASNSCFQIRDCSGVVGTGEKSPISLVCTKRRLDSVRNIAQANFLRPAVLESIPVGESSINCDCMDECRDTRPFLAAYRKTAWLGNLSRFILGCQHFQVRRAIRQHIYLFTSFNFQRSYLDAHSDVLGQDVAAIGKSEVYPKQISQGVDAGIIGYFYNGGLGSNQLLLHQRDLFLSSFGSAGGGIRCISGSISGFLVSAVHQNRRDGIDAKKDNTSYLHPFLILIPPIFFWLTSNFVMAMGWWKLRSGNCRRDTCYGVAGLYAGFLLSVWSGIVLAKRIF